MHKFTLGTPELFRQSLPKCAHSKIETNSACWNNHNCKPASNNCHKADTQEEKDLYDRVNAEYEACSKVPREEWRNHRDARRKVFGLPPYPCQKTFDTLIVTHDKKYFRNFPKGDGGNFHCECMKDPLTGKCKLNAQGRVDECECNCNTHAPCCSNRNKLLGGDRLLIGNRYLNVDKMQGCCDLCTNHPRCTAWEYNTDRVCILKHGAVEYVDNPTPGLLTTWAGTPSGTDCGGHTPQPATGPKVAPGGSRRVTSAAVGEEDGFAGWRISHIDPAAANMV